VSAHMDVLRCISWIFPLVIKLELYLGGGQSKSTLLVSSISKHGCDFKESPQSFSEISVIIRVIYHLLGSIIIKSSP
jgi:hypothetical protein